MRSITTLDLQYAHRFYGFKGEAQYLHGHTGVLTIEVEDSIEPGVNMVFPCNEIQKTAWEVLKNFDHALVLREDDPLLPAAIISALSAWLTLMPLPNRYRLSVLRPSIHNLPIP